MRHFRFVAKATGKATISLKNMREWEADGGRPLLFVALLTCAPSKWVLLSLPPVRSLPEGYTYLYSPASGHRYIVAPGGIKKVGQELLDYHVTGTVVTGAVRLRLGHDYVRTFRLDLKTHEVTLGDRVQADAH